jgi:hypothetical protein
MRRGHPDPLMLQALAADTARHIRRVRAVLEVVSPGSCQSGLREFYRLSDTPVTATYGASVTPKILFWLLPIVITFGLILGVSSGSWASPSAKRSASTAGRGGDHRRIQTFTRVALGTITSDITSDRG